MGATLPTSNAFENRAFSFHCWRVACAAFQSELRVFAVEKKGLGLEGLY